MRRVVLGAAVLAALALDVAAQPKDANVNKTADPEICKEGGEGLLLPAIGTEHEWPRGLQIVLYFFGLMYLFAGVALYADMFMVAIEAITSKQRVVTDEHGNQNFVKVWNPTVANLTLMALGSSAPEILLSLIEIVGNDFKSGSLGPSTIVGSAAFNLLVIIAVCTASLEESKKIWQHGVYIVTAVASLFAYIWLVIMLAVVSPDEIDAWEAGLTVFFFPLLVVVAWSIDAGLFTAGSLIDSDKVAEKKAARDGGESGVITQVGTDGKVVAVGKDDRKELEGKVTMVDKINAKRKAGMGHKTSPDPGHISSNEKAKIAAEMKTDQALQGGSRAKYRHVGIRKMFGKKAKVESKAKKRRSLFAAQRKLDDLEMVNPNTYDDRRSCIPEDPGPQSANPTEMGHITFYKAEAKILESGAIGCDKAPNGNACVYAAVQRLGAGNNAPEVKVTFSTVAGSATADGDFVPVVNEEIVFKPGEYQHVVSIEVIDDETFEDDEKFSIVLANPNDENDASDNSDGLLRGIIQCEVTIVNDDTITSFSERVTALLHLNHHKLVMGSAQWGEHIHDSIAPPAGGGAAAWVGYFVMLPWNLLNCLNPPTTLMGAWPCFLVSLGLVGFVTTLIGDMASLFGCAMGLSDEITAITFVALGTSLPDTFASRTAAMNEKYADAAVTNVTGSNSVNVFLGLGLSWLTASIYWEAQGEKFQVPAGSLVFGVIVFTCCSVIAMAILHVQRAAGGELGGPARWPMAITFIFLWCLYVVLSSLKSEGFY